MTTNPDDLHALHATRSVIAVAGGGLLLAMVLSFLAGRATARPPTDRAPEAWPAAPAAVAAPAAEPPPWSTHGFRDDESAQDGCVTTDCTG